MTVKKLSEITLSGGAPSLTDTVVGVSAGTTDLQYTFSQVQSAIVAGFAGRIQVTTDTTYYVATTGSDTTGDGSIGNPWATIQHAVNYVMYNITGEGILVTIQVADGTYNEFVYLGPHQIFAPGANYATVVLKFSSIATPAGVVIAPTSASVPALDAIISVDGQANWELQGGATFTFGASGISAALDAFNGGIMGIEFAAFVFSDHVPVFLDAEFNGSIMARAWPGSTVSFRFNSTVGSMALAEHASTIRLGTSSSVQFDVDPGLTGALGGMFISQFGTNSNISFLCTYSGSSAAAPSQSVISYGNSVYDAHQFLALSKYTIDDGLSRYNSTISILGIGVEPTHPLHIDAAGSINQIKISNDVDGNGVGIEFDDATHGTNWANGITNNNFFAYNAVAASLAWVVSTNSGNALNCIPGLGVYGWSDSATQAAGNPATGIGTQAVDTGLSRISASVVGVGNGTQGDFSGTLKLTDINTNNAAFMHRTSTTLNDGAAGNLGTLTTAPSAGDPTKWIPIDDNGVTRYIPAW